MENDVSLTGYSATSTQLHSTGGAQPALVMADNSTISNLYIEVNSDLSAVIFTSGGVVANSSLQNCIIRSEFPGAPPGPALVAFSLGGGPPTPIEGALANLSNCLLEKTNAGATAAIEVVGDGFVRLRDVYFGDLNHTGLEVGTAGVTPTTVLAEGCRFIATTGPGVQIFTGAELRVDPSTRWSSLTNAGTLTYYETAISPQYVPTVLADWSASDPIDVGTALDRIAAALGPIA